MTFHMITSFLMSLCALYLLMRCVLPLALPLWGKVAGGVVLFACAYKLQIFRLLFSGAVVPEIPVLWLIVSGWAFTVIILWTLLCLAWDIGLVARRLARRRVRDAEAGRGRAAPGSGRQGLRVAILLGSALVLASISTVQGVRVPPVKRVDIYVDNLPPALENFRIVQLSDLHISALFREHWAQEVVERANALHPDLAVLTGDIIDGTPRARARDVAPLAALRARYGVYACLGNHEYYAGMEPWVKALEGLGVRVLVNAHTELTVRGAEGAGQNMSATLVLGGTADPTGATRMGLAGADVAQTFAGSPLPGPAAWRLLLAHQPRLAHEAASHRVGLQLSGHTHGGQLFPASLLVGTFNEGYLAGLYREQGTQLYVSRGVGLWGGFPIRLGAPSEITEIILHRSGAAPAGTTR